jgi:hypothetical protein
VTLLGAGGIFGFEMYVNSLAIQKKTELEQREKSIDQATVTEFIRLRDRFDIAKNLLDHHIVLSQFFDVLEAITLQNVRFSTLRITADGATVPSIDMAGTAKNFNALAAQSSAFANEKRMKRAIFSDIDLDSKNGTVSFKLKANLETPLVTQSVESLQKQQAAQVGAGATTTTP